MGCNAVICLRAGNPKEKKGWIQKRSGDMIARLLAADGCSHFRKEELSKYIPL